MADPAVMAVPLGEADAFEVEYVDGVGRVVRTATDAVLVYPVRGLPPVLAFPAYRGQKHFTRWWGSATTGTHIPAAMATINATTRTPASYHVCPTAGV